MAYVQVYRSTGSRVLGAVVVGFCVLGLLSLLVAGSVAALLAYTAPLVLLGLLAWLAYWRPRVVLDEEGVTLHNVFRRVQVPWAALAEVQSRYGLRLDTPYGEFAAWAVPAPTGLARAGGVETEAALMVRQRWERLRALGEDVPAPGRGVEPEIRLDTAAVGAVIAAAAFAVAGAVVAWL